MDRLGDDGETLKLKHSACSGISTLRNADGPADRALNPDHARMFKDRNQGRPVAPPSLPGTPEHCALHLGRMVTRKLPGRFYQNAARMSSVLKRSPRSNGQTMVRRLEP